MFLLRETDRSVTEICFDVGFSSLGTFSRTFTRDRRRAADHLPLARGRPQSGPGVLREGVDETEQFWRSEARRRGSSFARMPNKITHTQVYVLDQDEALDFYVGKLGFEVNTDADLGFMRWLTVNFPGQPDRQLLLEKPGPPAHDEATAEQIRELVTKGALGMAAIIAVDDVHKTYEELVGPGRRVHRGADRALLRHRLRPARPVRQPAPDRHAEGGPDRDPGRGFVQLTRVRRRRRPT